MNPLAIASLVCGILAYPMLCCCYGFPFNLLGLALGIVAVVQSNSDPTMGGKGLAYGGIGASVFSMLLAVGFVVLGVGMSVLGPMLEQM
jgi:hypothetical protein